MVSAEWMVQPTLSDSIPQAPHSGSRQCNSGHCCIRSLHSRVWEQGKDEVHQVERMLEEVSVALERGLQLSLEGILSRIYGVNTDIDMCSCRRCSGLVLTAPRSLFFTDAWTMLTKKGKGWSWRNPLSGSFKYFYKWSFRKAGSLSAWEGQF